MAASGRTFERRTRPKPCSLLGHVSDPPRETVPLPVTGTPDAMRTARMSAALGVIASGRSGRPEGYHPSMKYCRTIAAAAAAAGVEELVPHQRSSGLPVPLGGLPSDIADS